MKRIALRNVVICDKVTRDDRGFPNAHGIYPGAVELDKKPSLFDASLFAGFSADIDEDVVVQFSLILPKGRGSGEMSLNKSTDFFDVEVPVLGFASEEGEISFRWRVIGGRWSTPIKWKIFFSDDAVELSEDERVAQRALFAAKARVMDLSEVGKLHEMSGQAAGATTSARSHSPG